MAVQLKRKFFSAKEYLEQERTSPEKNEYFNGDIFAMAGASRRHNLISGNVFSSLHTQLRKRPCEVYPSDMRVKIKKTGLYTYPDVVVICGKPQFEDSKKDVLLNPTVLVEVLSPSTEAYDRGDKFGHYRTISTLSDYLLIAQSKILVEHYVRQPNNSWLLTLFSEPSQTVTIQTIECSLLLEEIYEKVNFEEEES
ncbi:MAG: Uma2 family endonuclease [Caldilineaceae bacterium]